VTMSQNDGEEPRAAERPELIAPRDGSTPDRQDRQEAVSEPGKVMRIGAMTKQLLDELRNIELDQPSRERLRAIHATAVEELAEVLSPDLQAELQSFALPFTDEAPSELELRVAQAQLVGWLEGLFQGIQLTLVSQQVAAKQQLENMRAQAQLSQRAGGGEPRPGTYL
jgi:hypothetical protein